MPQAFAQLPLHQQTYTPAPQTKLLEFLLAILAGLPHLQDLSHAAHPLDQDLAVAAAWHQPTWADASGVCRSLPALTQPEAEQITHLLTRLSRPFIDYEVLLAVRRPGRVVYAGDLTGRPVANTSTTYPGAAYGHMSDSVHLGYQAALLSMHSPTYGRPWLAVTPHPGYTRACSQAEALVRAAEARTGVRPGRRVARLQARVQASAAQCAQRIQQLRRAEKVLDAVERERTETQRELWYWQAQVSALAGRQEPPGSASRPYSKLNRARARVAPQEKRLPKLERRVPQLRQWVTAAAQRLARVSTEHAHLAQLEQDNATNSAPTRAEFRLDGGSGRARTWPC